MPQVQIQKTLNLNLSDIPGENLASAKQEVGEYLVNETIRYMEEGRSPVAGEPPWPKLDKDYAAEEHNGDRTPTLNATGRLRESLQFRVSDDGVEVGIFHKSEQAKADGHNNFSGKSQLPQRRFVPSGGQSYRSEIMANVDRILNAYRTADVDVGGQSPDLSAGAILTTAIDRILRGNIEDTGILTIAALVGEESLQEVLGRRFG